MIEARRALIVRKVMNFVRRFMVMKGRWTLLVSQIRKVFLSSASRIIKACQEREDYITTLCSLNAIEELIVNTNRTVERSELEICQTHSVILLGKFSCREFIYDGHMITNCLSHFTYLVGNLLKNALLTDEELKCRVWNTIMWWITVCLT